jgi:hypothetical protein
MRTMYDSTTAADIPAGAQMVGGYVDGKYAWTPADWARFPNATHVKIAVFATTNDGTVGDREQGDMTEADLVTWVRMRRAAGVDPTGYCSESNWPACRAAFAAAGEPEPHWWVASYPGAGAVIPAGAVAHQYADPITSGGHWDLSAVADYWPGIDPAGGTDMFDQHDRDDLRQVLNQLMGPWKSWAPGAPDTAAFTLVDYARAIDKNVNVQGAQISGLVAVIAAATKDPNITEARLRTVFREELAAQIQITGTVDIHVAPVVPKV